MQAVQAMASARTAASQRDMDRRQYLRHHQCRGKPLQCTGDDEEGNRCRHAAEQRGEAEHQDGHAEHASAAEIVTEAGAHGQADRKGDAISGNEEFEFGLAGFQRGGDGGKADIDNGKIELQQQLPGEHDHQADLAKPNWGG